MEQASFGQFSESTKFDQITKDDLISKYTLLEEEYLHALKEIYRLKNQSLTDDQLKLFLEERLSELQGDLYGTSSERYKKPEDKKEKEASSKPRVKKPSERYPNIPVRDVLVPFDEIPMCDSCGKNMTDSGMTEESEQLTVIPKKYEIINWIRPKFRCSCHGCIKTAVLPPRIIEGSSYSDEMIIDVVASKYCDLIPIQRYVGMADRGGLIGLPPQSLIELTHGFADFVSLVYDLLKREVLNAKVLNADETPHKMLEGSDTKNWYLWGFSTSTVCFLECHSTRSGDVASEILLNSKCEFLVTDVYSGYGKATRQVNEVRLKENRTQIKNAFCSAHARRYFFKPRLQYKEADFYLENYQQIYRLNAESKGKPPDKVLEIRSQMKPHFEDMRKKATEELFSYPHKNKYQKALSYFLENYQGLTLFLNHPEVPIDNNAQERLLRSHVVGRKTWYGTHSERGAKTAAILFSLIESCKLNQVNPRTYLENLAKDLLSGKSPYTPKDFKDLQIS